MSISSLTNGTASVAQRALTANMDASAKALTQLASGNKNNRASEDSAAQAITAQLNALIGVLEKTADNAMQASSLIQLAASSQNKILDMLAKAEQLAAASASDALSDSDRAKTQQEFQRLMNSIDATASQTRWNGISLLSGGAGTLTVASAAVTTATATGVNAVANAFAAGLTTASGLINGSATSVSVQNNGSQYNISVTIGGQNFAATVSAPATAGTLTLTSTTDPRNTIQFTYDATSVSAITNATTFQSSLASLLGLDTGIGSTFSSTTTTMADATATSNISAITTGAATQAGTYALSYDTNTENFTLTNGNQVWQTTFATGDTAISFDNGVTVALAGTPAALTNSQLIFTVTTGSAVSLSFQVGEEASDTVSVSIGGATTATLGLSSANVLTVDSARAALTTVSNAIAAVTSVNAQIGAQQLELDYHQQVNTLAIENLSQARMVFNDTEMEKAMTDFTKYQVLSNVATAMLSQANRQISDVITQLTRQ